jgi:hypothetical protein
VLNEVKSIEGISGNDIILSLAAAYCTALPFSLISYLDTYEGAQLELAVSLTLFSLARDSFKALGCNLDQYKSLNSLIASVEESSLLASSKALMPSTKIGTKPSNNTDLCSPYSMGDGLV